jgi:CheY-like chemotaxis protein
MSDKQVLFVDDDSAARDSYERELSDLFGKSVTILTAAPKGTLTEMLEQLLNYPNLVSLVVDERLVDTGSTDYKGIELAALVRSRFPKLPIYILTNYPDDIVEGGFNIEYVFDKTKLSEDEDEYKKTACARVRRHLDVFDDILSEREQRYAELLPKFLGNELNSEEYTEFLQLEAVRIKPLSHEFVDDVELNNRLDKQAAILREIDSVLKKGN